MTRIPFCERKLEICDLPCRAFIMQHSCWPFQSRDHPSHVTTLVTWPQPSLRSVQCLQWVTWASHRSVHARCTCTQLSGWAGITCTRGSPTTACPSGPCRARWGRGAQCQLWAKIDQKVLMGVCELIMAWQLTALSGLERFWGCSGITYQQSAAHVTDQLQPSRYLVNLLWCQTYHFDDVTKTWAKLIPRNVLKNKYHNIIVLIIPVCVYMRW